MSKFSNCDPLCNICRQTSDITHETFLCPGKIYIINIIKQAYFLQEGIYLDVDINAWHLGVNNNHYLQTPNLQKDFYFLAGLTNYIYNRMNYNHLSSHINLANLLVSSYKTLYTNYSKDILQFQSTNELMRLPALYCEPRIGAHMDDKFISKRDT